MTGRHLPRVDNAPGRTSFKGAIRQGLNTGIIDTTTIGEVVLTQRADVSAAETSATTLFVLPNDTEGGLVRSDIHRFDIVVDVLFEASADASLKVFRASAGGSLLGEIELSAASQYGMVPGATIGPTGVYSAGASASAEAWFDNPGTPIVAFVSGTGTAPDTGHLFITMYYSPR